MDKNDGMLRGETKAAATDSKVSSWERGMVWGSPCPRSPNRIQAAARVWLSVELVAGIKWLLLNLLCNVLNF